MAFNVMYSFIWRCLSSSSSLVAVFDLREWNLLISFFWIWPVLIR